MVVVFLAVVVVIMMMILLMMMMMVMVDHCQKAKESLRNQPCCGVGQIMRSHPDQVSANIDET